MKIQEIIDRLIAWHQPYENPKTRDTIKCGDPNQECTGIAITCYASVEVIEQTIANGCNLLIAHESIYYGDGYALEQFQGLKGFEAKKKMIEDSGIVIFRDHDHMHGKGKPWVPERVRNDYIYYGIMKESGLEPYVIGDIMKPLRYQIPPCTAEVLAETLMEKMNLNGVRIVGDPATVITEIFFCEHCSGDKGDDQRILEVGNANCIIPLEICDYTMTTYVRDCNAAGDAKVILEFGHFNMEELGMKYMQKWLPEAVGISANMVHYYPAADPFTYQLRKR